MEDRIRAYVDQLFQNAPSTQKAYELKVELTGNLIEKYNTLISEGKTPEQAFEATIESIGDVSELFGSLAEPAMYQPMPLQSQSGKSPLLTAIAVMMFVLSVIPVVLLQSIIGVLIMVIIIAFGIGLLVMASAMKPKQYTNATVVDDFRTWQNKTESDKQMKKAINTALWPIILIIYFLISFSTGMWYITWIIFIAGIAIEGLIQALFAYRNMK